MRLCFLFSYSYSCSCLDSFCTETSFPPASPEGMRMSMRKSRSERGTQEFFRSRSDLGDILFVRAFHALRHVLVAVISLVNLLHAVERLFPRARPLVNKSQIVEDLFLHGVH